MSTATSDVVGLALDRLRWTVTDLWVATVGIGGDLSRYDLAAIVAGSSPATPMEHDTIAVALNDRLVELGEGRPVAYWDELPA
jgi:hypothetical protein